MNWLTGWISLGEKNLRSARRSPPVSSLTLRSLPMTSGLFNTGVTGDSEEITSHALTGQPSPSTSSKFMSQEFSAETFESEFDMNMFEDLGPGFEDPLGDASLDSFTDLTALLTGNSFLDQIVDEDKVVSSPVHFVNFNDEPEPEKKAHKRSFQEMEMEDASSDLNKLTASVSLATSTHDHDYSTKRPRTSTVTAEPSVVKVEEIFLSPPTPPAPSTSFVISAPVEDKSRNRREKNNIASKRSREIRKQKFAGMEVEAERLIEDNARLQQRIEQLEKLAKQMKEILVAKMAGK